MAEGTRRRPADRVSIEPFSSCFGGFQSTILFFLGQYDVQKLLKPSQSTLKIGVTNSEFFSITVIHGVWYRAGIQIQNFLGWVKVGLVIFMVLSALYVVIFGQSQDDLEEPTTSFGPDGWDGLWEGSDWSFGTIATSLFKVFYSYAGLTNLNNVMNEVKDPVRTLKSVSLSALVTACFLYLLANLAYFAVKFFFRLSSSLNILANNYLKGGPRRGDQAERPAHRCAFLRARVRPERG